jgi:diaminohydroxyphosphoribosylaminopyrimidine deaminase/5-amino-6-(5-phosphoribosylamino)uracil reductase
MVALQKAGKEADGATLYLNLEPCVHYGKTPPCAPAVIASGVRGVVIGMEDPNPLVKGRGIEALKRAGLDVRLGILEEECRRLNEAFCKYIVKKEPFVILKVAATLDGKISTRDGESQWISGKSSRRLVHRLRNQVDGVVVGIGTILKDDPLLTTRIKGGRDPCRIVFDTRLRIPENAKVIKISPSRTIIATTELGPREKVVELEKKGVQVFVFASKNGRVDAKSCLSRLGELGMMCLLVEGGGKISGAFLDERLIDKIFIFLSPKLIGDPQAPGIFGGHGVTHLKEAISIKNLKVKKVGEDILVECYL